MSEFLTVAIMAVLAISGCSLVWIMHAAPHEAAPPKDDWWIDDGFED